MSTTIEVYPSINAMPLVEQIRTRAQELFQELLDRYNIKSTVEIKAYFLVFDSKGPEVPIGSRWEKDIGLCFQYLINGQWKANTWPSCYPFDDDDRITEEDLKEDESDAEGSAPEFLGQLWFAEEYAGRVPASKLTRAAQCDHRWDEYRNLGGHAVASTEYGLVAAALDEATDGFILSVDSAFEESHNGEGAAEFLSWWGDRQMEMYGVQSFL